MFDVTSVTGGEVRYERKVATAQFESATVSISVTLAEGGSIEETVANLENLVESRIIAANQKRELRGKFYAALMRVNVPVEDGEQALAVLGLVVPRTSLEYRAMIDRINEVYNGGAAGLPEGWLWWRDGKHPAHGSGNGKATGQEQEAEVESEAD